MCGGKNNKMSLVERHDYYVLESEDRVRFLTEYGESDPFNSDVHDEHLS